LSGGVTEAIGEAKLRPGRNSLADALIKALFIALTLAFITAVLLAPLITVFVEAFGQGLELDWGSFRNSETAAAIRTTLAVAAVVVPVNTLFGIAAAWAIAKFDFRGKTVLLAAGGLANIRGGTTTMPLHIEQLYQDYSPVAAFAVASLLALLAVVTLVLKTLLEWRMSAR
jgi:ABC-type sulfate transport system permease subunit